MLIACFSTATQCSTQFLSQDKETWLAITGPQIVADYTDYPAVGRLTIASPEQIFDASFTVSNLGDKRRKYSHPVYRPWPALAQCHA